MKAKHTFKRIVNYEFWPLWVFYAPFTFLWLFNSIKSGSLFYFMRANPGMKFGGLFQNSKYDTLRQLKQQYFPRTIYVETKDDLQQIAIQDLKYPFICKPDMGERGKGIVLIRSKEDWEAVKGKLQFPSLLQEFINAKLEFGVLYYRQPNGKSGITSIVSKGFLKVTGDGEQTLKELIASDLRAAPRQQYFFKKFESRLTEVLARGESVLLEEIGNHCKGTTFYNSNDLINSKLVELFDDILEPIDEFYYGRVDLKVPSVEDLYRGENIKIMEVNGVNSEVTHIYDPHYKLLQAYKDVAYNLNLVYKIAKANKEQPSNVSWGSFLKAVKTQFLN